jgi:hypothetical protein
MSVNEPETITAAKHNHGQNGTARRGAQLDRS